MSQARQDRISFGSEGSKNASYRINNFSHRPPRPNSPRPSDPSLTDWITGRKGPDAEGTTPKSGHVDAASKEQHPQTSAFDSVLEEPEFEDMREPSRRPSMALDLSKLEANKPKSERPLRAIASKAALSSGMAPGASRGRTPVHAHGTKAVVASTAPSALSRRRRQLAASIGWLVSSCRWGLGCCKCRHRRPATAALPMGMGLPPMPQKQQEGLT